MFVYFINDDDVVKSRSLFCYDSVVLANRLYVFVVAVVIVIVFVAFFFSV